MTLNRAKYIMLMAIRCEFVDIGGAKLTKKGKGFLSASQWRLVNKLRCFLSARYRKDMYDLLTKIINDEIQRNKLDELKPNPFQK